MKREEHPRNAKIDLDLVAADVVSKESLRSKKSESWMNFDVLEGRRMIFNHEDGDLFSALNHCSSDEKKQ